MIVSAVVDPEVFSPVSVLNELSKREVIQFLKRIIRNGVLLDAPTCELIRAGLVAASGLGTGMGQRIVGLLEEIYKQKKKFIVECRRDEWSVDDAATVSEKSSVLAKLLDADCVMAVSSNVSVISCKSECEVVDASHYSESEFERRGFEFERVEEPFERMNLYRQRELLGRAVKYASTIRVFDYLMVSSSTQIGKYIAGIQIVLDAWRECCVLGDVRSRRVELYTVGEKPTKSGYLNSSEALTRMQNVTTDLNGDGMGEQVIGYVKRDPEPKIFHTRGFEARGRAFMIDPGFDALGSPANGRRILFCANAAAEKHFVECRSLENVANSE